jgi:hypothetical protein
VCIALAAAWLPVACGSESGADASADAAAPPAPYSWGYVTMSQHVGGSLGDYGLASAKFHEFATLASCPTVVDENDCQAVACGPGDSPSFMSPIGLDAGEVVVVGQRELELTRIEDGSYLGATVLEPIWTPGQMIQISVQGANGNPPPFSTAVEGPSSITLTSPAAGASISVDPAQGLAISWEGGPFGTVTVGAGSTSGPSRSLWCRWPIADHGRTVPPAVLAALSPGDYELEVRADTATDSYEQVLGHWVFSAGAMTDAVSIPITLAPSSP